MLKMCGISLDRNSLNVLFESFSADNEDDAG